MLIGVERLSPLLCDDAGAGMEQVAAGPVFAQDRQSPNPSISGPQDPMKVSLAEA